MSFNISTVSSPSCLLRSVRWKIGLKISTWDRRGLSGHKIRQGQDTADVGYKLWTPKHEIFAKLDILKVDGHFVSNFMTKKLWGKVNVLGPRRLVPINYRLSLSDTTVYHFLWPSIFNFDSISQIFRSTIVRVLKLLSHISLSKFWVIQSLTNLSTFSKRKWFWFFFYWFLTGR